MIRNVFKKESWANIDRLSGCIVTYFNQVLDAEVLEGAQKAELMDLAKQFILKSTSSRNLYGVELARFFKLIRQLQEHQRELGLAEDIFDHRIMNVSCNLRTLGVNLLEKSKTEEGSDEEPASGIDMIFKRENEGRLEKDL